MPPSLAPAGRLGMVTNCQFDVASALAGRASSVIATQRNNRARTKTLWRLRVIICLRFFIVFSLQLDRWKPIVLFLTSPNTCCPEGGVLLNLVAALLTSSQGSDEAHGRSPPAMLH